MRVRRSCCFPCAPSVPAPPAGNLRITDVTHSAMKLSWDAAPGEVDGYTITYSPEEGDLREVRARASVHDPAALRRLSDADSSGLWAWFSSVLM